MVRLAAGLAAVRGEPDTERGILLDAAIAAMSGRVRVYEDQSRTAEEVIADLLDAALATEDGDRASLSPPPPPPSPGQIPGRRPPGPISAPEAQGESRGGGPADAQPRAARGSHIKRSRRSRHRSAASTTMRSPMRCDATQTARSRCSRTWPWRRIRPCARTRGGWPAGCCRRSDGSDSRAGAAPGASSPGPGDADGDIDIERTLERNGGMPPRRAGQLVPGSSRPPPRRLPAGGSQRLDVGSRGRARRRSGGGGRPGGVRPPALRGDCVRHRDHGPARPARRGALRAGHRRPAVAQGPWHDGSRAGAAGRGRRSSSTCHPAAAPRS